MHKQLTPCEKLGYKVGMRFRIKKWANTWKVGFTNGPDVELIKDGGGDHPIFKDPTHINVICQRLDNVKPIIRVRAGEPFEHLLPKPVQCNCGSWTCPTCAKPD